MSDPAEASSSPLAAESGDALSNVNGNNGQSAARGGHGNGASSGSSGDLLNHIVKTGERKKSYQFRALGRKAVAFQVRVYAAAGFMRDFMLGFLTA